MYNCRMELWFVFALISAVGGGLFIFTTKVAAERDYDIMLLSTAAITLSGFILSVPVIVRGDYTGLSWFVLTMIVLNGLGYTIVNALRHYAMQCIDTAIYYPLYKTLTPLLAIAFGYVLFGERFTTYEWIGLVLSLLVPLLLISHAEKGRQKNLARGLQLLVIAALFAVCSSVTVKAGTDATHNTWLFAALTDFGIVFAGIAWLLFRNKKVPLTNRLLAFRDRSFVILTFWMGLMSAISFGGLVFAFEYGTLSIVYTVQSLYILIPIILSIIFYNEHWNVRKVVAIVLSIAALGLLK